MIIRIEILKRKLVTGISLIRDRKFAMVISIVRRKFKFATLRSLLKLWIVDGVFGEIPRLIFGNPAGLGNNVGPIVNSTLLRIRKATAPYSGVTFHEVDQLRKVGYTLVNPSYDPKMIHDVIRKYKNVIQNQLLIRPNSKYSIEIKNPIQTIPELNGLLNTYVKDLLHSFYGSSFKVVESTCFRTFHIFKQSKDAEYYSDFWHCDRYPVTWLKVYVLLSDWNENTGPTEMLSIQKTKKIMRTGYINRYFSLVSKKRMALYTSQVIKPIAPAGNVFIFNPHRCLHRAGNPRDGQYRDAIMFHVAGSSSQYDDI